MKNKNLWKPTDDLFEITIAGDNVTSFVKPNELVPMSTQIYYRQFFFDEQSKTYSFTV